MCVVFFVYEISVQAAVGNNKTPLPVMQLLHSECVLPAGHCRGRSEGSGSCIGAQMPLHCPTVGPAASPAGRAGLFVLCCAVFAPSPLGGNSHSAAGSSPGHRPRPREFISAANVCGSSFLRFPHEAERKRVSFLFVCHQLVSFRFDRLPSLMFPSEGGDCVFVPGRITCRYSGCLEKEGTDCLFTERSQEAIRQKIALENGSF